jgi:hypothetical protein
MKTAVSAVGILVIHGEEDVKKRCHPEGRESGLKDLD